MSTSNITKEEMDALNEVGNVGIGNATTALSKILKKPVGINIPESKFVPLKELSHEFGGPNRLITGLHYTFSGDAKGECLFAFDDKDSKELIDLLLEKPIGTTKKLGEMEKSAFMEMSSIFTTSYLNALAAMMNAKIIPSLVDIANAIVKHLTDSLVMNLTEAANEVLCVKTKINIEGYSVDGVFVLMLETESMKYLLTSLKRKYSLDDNMK